MYAKRVWTHLFELSRVDEAGAMDIVYSICTGLKLEDRLSWNEELRRLGRTCTLNAFGSWVCIFWKFNLMN